LLAVFGGGVNSDYYPLVDQDAPKARFVGETANGLMRVATAGVPVGEMLAGERVRDFATGANPISPPLRLTLLQSASATAVFLRDGTADARFPPLLPRDVGMLRAFVHDCASLPPRVRPAELMLGVAEVVNAGLPTAQSVAVWQGLRSARCASRFDEADLAWLGLFEAVAARDAARMADLAPPLAQRSDASPGLRAYAVLAGATGLLATGRQQEAQRFLDTAAPSLPEAARNDSALRLVGAMVREDLVRQAAVH
jgi:hypothetical protein